MSSTMTYQLRSTPTRDHGLSRYSNAASAPLPLIPRRPPPTIARSQTYPSNGTVVKIHPTSPEEKPGPLLPSPKICTIDDSDTTSTSSVSDNLRPVIAPRAKRIRGQRVASIFPPAVAASQPLKTYRSQGHHELLDDSPSIGAPKLNNDALDHRFTPDSDIISSTSSDTPSLTSSDTPSLTLTIATPHPEITIPPNVEANLIRKKSGQLVKSSLKSTRSQERGSLAVLTHGLSTKSEPVTPTHSKAVKFDAHLEHVKLFLAEQKPLAVSRDGSPTTDTSGTDNDFPSFIYGTPAEAKSGDVLSMKVVNMPARLNQTADVVLTDLKLSQDMMTIVGNVRVRNIAFHKWIAVRFTFDSWQTTSEVATRHACTLPGGGFDMFAFSIRLNDVWSRIEEKTLIMAIRYNVEGREIWDNNNGHNYIARFNKVKNKREPDDDASSGSDVANNLATKLEDVVRREGLLLRRANQVDKSDTPPSFKDMPSLSSRYDLSASFKTTWKPPSPYAATRNSIPWPPKATPITDRKPVPLPLRKKPAIPLGSPRDMNGDDIDGSRIHIACDDEDSPFHRNRSGRNHHRSHLDIALSDPGNLRRTPPGTPIAKSIDNKLVSPIAVEPNRLPPVENAHVNKMTMGWRRDSGGSESSTPSILSPASSSRSASPSPSELFMMNCMTGPHPDDDRDSAAGYNRFLDTFCFYTGRENGFALDTALTSDTPARSLSASSIDTLLSTSPRRSPEQRLSHFSTPTRSQSFDEMVYRSGSSTPTAKAHSPLRINAAT